MNVSRSTIENLDSFLKEHQEADVISLIAKQLCASADEALAIYFGSPISAMIENGEHGTQFLPSSYLAEEVMKNSSKF